MNKILSSILILTLVFGCNKALYQSTNTTKHALLITIGDFEDTDWRSLQADNDYKVIAELANKLDFELTSIRNDQATAKGIRAIVNRFMNSKSLDEGDIVWIYISSHGQQLCDVLPIDEKDNYDEALVCYDSPRNLESNYKGCLLYTSPSPRDATLSRMPSSA